MPITPSKEKVRVTVLNFPAAVTSLAAVTWPVSFVWPASAVLTADCWWPPWCLPAKAGTPPATKPSPSSPTSAARRVLARVSPAVMSCPAVRVIGSSASLAGGHDTCRVPRPQHPPRHEPIMRGPVPRHMRDLTYLDHLGGRWVTLPMGITGVWRG